MNDSCRHARIALLEGAPGHEDHVAGCADCQRVAAAIERMDDHRHDQVTAWLARPIEPAEASHDTPSSWRPIMTTVTLVLAAAVALATPLLPGKEASEPPSSPAVELMNDVDALALVPWNQKSEADWERSLLALWNTGRDEHADMPPEQVFRWLTQIGRAAENASHGTPPFYDAAPNGSTVNVGWAAAACLAADHPDGQQWIDGLGDDELKVSIAYLHRQRDEICPLPVDWLYEHPGASRPAEADLASEIAASRWVPLDAIDADGWAVRARALLKAAASQELADEERFLFELVLGRATQAAELRGAGWTVTDTSGNEVPAGYARAACLARVTPALRDILDPADTELTAGLELAKDVRCDATP